MPEQWRDNALADMTRASMGGNDPLVKPLDDAERRIGDLIMELEILHRERPAKHPSGGGR